MNNKNNSNNNNNNNNNEENINNNKNNINYNINNNNNNNNEISKKFPKQRMKLNSYDDIFDRKKITLNLLDFITENMEFTARFVFLNIPTGIIAACPELERMSSFSFAYLIMQVVGFCYACLVNASFALACEITAYLPPLNSKIVNSKINENQVSILNKLFTGDSGGGMELMANFYISYASIRIVVSFATGVFNIALESIKDFPDLAKVLQKGGLETLKLAPTIFIPSLIMLLGILSADPICSLGEKNESDNKSMILKSIIVPIANGFCQHSGLYFFTSKFPEIRRLTFVAIMVMVIQIWQISMNQFPHWDRVLQKIPYYKKIIFQVTVVILAILTIAATLFSWIKLHDFVSIEILCGVLLGWTLWLFAFTPILIETNGQAWAQNQNLEQDIIDSAVVVRISHLMILAVMFFGLFFFHGFLRAQLDMTIATIVIPTLYSSVYLFCSLSLKAGSTLVKVGLPIALVGSLFINVYLAKQNAKGSVLLVFCHLFGKLVQYFGNDDENDDDDLSRKGSIDEDDDILSTGLGVKSQNDDDDYGNYIDHEDEAKNQYLKLVGDFGISKNVIDGKYVNASLGDLTNITIEGKPANLRSTHLSEGNMSQLLSDKQKALGSKKSSAQSLNSDRRSTDALSKLAIRGTESSSLVSLNLPENVRNHWIVKSSKENVTFVSKLARAIAIPDSILSGFIRAFIGVALIFFIILVFLGLAGELQKNLHYFPSFIDFHKLDDGTLLIDHKISNITLFPRQNILNKSNEVSCLNYEMPHYGICNFEWSGLSVLDFAILSELAYFDEDEDEYGKLQNMVDLIFPDMDFVATLSKRKVSGPMYLEVSSTKLNLSVISIRGTDIGRMNDLMEDIKLYAEPIIFTLLSTVFPTIRLWSTDTTSKVIEWLFHFNSFFGLQGEAKYYLALAQHVYELEKDKNKQIFMTGHSLGGGLARIVGTLTGHPSISFSPPGFALSYRKYSAYHPNGSYVEINSKGAMHHNSVAIVTEYDMITQIDNQVGMVQQILCDRPDQAHITGCHLLEGTICHLLKHCGDKRFESCKFDFDVTHLAPSILEFGFENQWSRVILIMIGLVILSIILAIVPMIV